MTEEAATVVKKIEKAIELCALWYSVPADRLRAHAWAETTYDSEGTNTHVISGDGGMGLWQIERGIHPIADDDSAFDVLVSTAWAARFLALLYKRTGDWRSASRDYNGSGPAAEDYTNKITSFMSSKPWTACVQDANA